MSKPEIKGLYLSYDDSLTQVHFDVTVSDEVESVLEATEHPVETGGNITDNARLRMKRFAFEVVVSDTPINEGVRPGGSVGAVTQTVIQVPGTTREIPLNPLGAAVEGSLALVALVTKPYVPTTLTALTWSSPFNAVGDMLDLLTKLQSDVTLLKVVTSKYSFDNCLLTSVRQMRDKDIGSGARYRLEFKQLRMVTLEFTDSPVPAEPRGKKGTTNKGNKKTQTKPIKKGSVALNVVKDVVAQLKASLGL